MGYFSIDLPSDESEISFNLIWLPEAELGVLFEYPNWEDFQTLHMSLQSYFHI